MTDRELLERDFTLREGDTLIVPKGWRVELRGRTVSAYGPGYMAESKQGFSWAAFIMAAAEIGREK